jgi:hypothetical protein
MLASLSIGIFSFLANLISLAFLVFGQSGYSPAVIVAAVCLVGASIGGLLASTFKNASPWPVGLGAFVAALVASIPVVLATYGFALLGVPLLAAYGACVGVGAWYVRRARLKAQRST